MVGMGGVADVDMRDTVEKDGVGLGAPFQGGPPVGP